MSETKLRPERARGNKAAPRWSLYDDVETMALLQEMARQEDSTPVALLRRLVRTEAATRGVALPLIVRDPARCGGHPILAGTRTAVHDVVSYFRMHAGDLDEVRAELPHLSPEQISAALAYYEEHGVEIDAHEHRFTVTRV